MYVATDDFCASYYPSKWEHGESESYTIQNFLFYFILRDIEPQKGFKASQGLLWNPVYQYESMWAYFIFDDIFVWTFEPLKINGKTDLQ